MFLVLDVGTADETAIKTSTITFRNIFDNPKTKHKPTNKSELSLLYKKVVMNHERSFSIYHNVCIFCLFKINKLNENQLFKGTLSKDNHKSENPLL